MTQLTSHTATQSLKNQANDRANFSQSEQALARVQNVLAREIPGMNTSALQKLNAQDYTPDKIAERISQFVTRGLNNARAQGKSEAEVQSLYDSAMRGAEKGFKDAKAILKNLDLLNENISEQVLATEDKTFAALRKLSPSSQSSSLDAMNSISVVAAQRYEKAEDFQLSLQTKDGDTVNISFSRALNAQASLGLSMDGATNQAAVFDVNRSESTGYQFKVEGNLSAEEIDAIQNLVRDVGQVANQFFNGDVQQAFAQAPNIAFDDSQLSSMRLRLSRSEQTTAVNQYQQTQQLNNPVNNSVEQRIGKLARELNDAAKQPALDFLAQARAAVNEIMRGLVQQDSRLQTASSDQQATYQNHLNRLLGINSTATI
ncbi:hypothetical protein CKO09_09490 [Chromatium weissei]|nr:hypothetical protein [Chromatium weissei]